MRSWNVAKGHGTENDFVIVIDRHGLLNPSAEDVRLLCNRRTGVGGDGLLRVIRGRHIDDWSGDPDVWFMDYRNADGSVSEMCGNGVRVFARYLLEEGLVNGPTIPVATRAGLRTVTLERSGLLRVDMGRVLVDAETTLVRLGERTWDAVPADVGNPHAVCFVDSVDILDLTRAPEFSRQRFPAGVNIEFIEVVGPDHVRMRVFERGVGETRSCGTGTVAAAAVARARLGGEHWRVDVPGGTLQIDLTPEAETEARIERAYMSGPAVVQVRGEVLLPDA
jgi:diaminopimelate epimerase